MENKKKILSIGLDFMNCAELHLNEENFQNYANEELYSYKFGYISPMWSRKITLEIMKMASVENWDILIHDCSNYTKYIRDLNATKKLELFGFHNYNYNNSSRKFIIHAL